MMMSGRSPCPWMRVRSPRSELMCTICITFSVLPEQDYVKNLYHILKKISAISAGLKDSNPRVRKAAVVGCGKVWKHSPSVIEENGMVDVLYTMVRDPDPHVLTFAIQTINVILSKEGGIVINSTMANYLISRFYSIL